MARRAAEPFAELGDTRISLNDGGTAMSASQDSIKVRTLERVQNGSRREIDFDHRPTDFGLVAKRPKRTTATATSKRSDPRPDDVGDIENPPPPATSALRRERWANELL
jgi:hypothetical protein